MEQQIRTLQQALAKAQDANEIGLKERGDLESKLTSCQADSVRQQKEAEEMQREHAAELERVIKGDRWQSPLNWYFDDVQTVQLKWDHQKQKIAARSFSEWLL